MPNKFAIINYERCNFSNCADGKCKAIKICEKKVIKQEKAFEVPYINISLCIGCYKCVKACESKAIEKGK